jgi:hypothetical protein
MKDYRRSRGVAITSSAAGLGDLTAGTGLRWAVNRVTVGDGGQPLGEALIDTRQMVTPVTS